MCRVDDTTRPLGQLPRYFGKRGRLRLRSRRTRYLTKTLPFSAMSRAKAADMACAERSEAGESVAKLLRNRVLLSPYESGASGART